MEAIFISMALLAGCGPTDQQTAQKCAVSVDALKQARANVKRMEPYSGIDLGKCSVIKDDAAVEVILPEAKHNAELMVEEGRVLDAIADQCGVPRSVWGGDDAHKVQVAPAGLSTAKIDCLVSGFRKSKLPAELEYFWGTRTLHGTQN